MLSNFWKKLQGASVQRQNMSATLTKKLKLINSTIAPFWIESSFDDEGNAPVNGTTHDQLHNDFIL